jgi:hypothetical protein
MPNLRSFNLLQRLPVVSIGPIRWLAGRDHRNPERNVYPSPDCRYASGCTLPDNLPVIPCACRAGMRLVLLVTGVDSAELRRDQLGPVQVLINGAPGGSSSIHLYVDARIRPANSISASFAVCCACCRICANPIQPIQQTPTTSHRETFLLNEMNCSVTGAARLDTVGS